MVHINRPCRVIVWDNEILVFTKSIHYFFFIIRMIVFTLLMGKYYNSLKGNDNTADEGGKISVFAGHLRALSRVGSVLHYTCYDKGYRIIYIWSTGLPDFIVFYNEEGVMRTYSNRNPLQTYKNRESSAIIKVLR